MSADRTLGATTMRSFLNAVIGALTDDNGMTDHERMVTACAEAAGALALLDAAKDEDRWDPRFKQSPETEPRTPWPRVRCRLVPDPVSGRLEP